VILLCIEKLLIPKNGSSSTISMKRMTEK